MEEYEKLHRIGSGGQGKIIKVRHKKTGIQYACKMIMCRDNYEMNFALKEIKMLMDLRHEHIIAYKDFFIHKDKYGDLHVCLVMELCEQGDVSKKIRDAKRKHTKFLEPRLVKWTTQLCSALEYIHGQDILHRDLKPTNVFFTGEDDVKIGDFGLSTAITATGRCTVVGTPYYFAPELLLQQTYDAKVDMWGLGIVLMELCTLKERPINGQVLNNPKVVDELETEIIQQGYSSDLAALIKNLLDKRPECRPSAGDVLCRFSYTKLKYVPSDTAKCEGSKLSRCKEEQGAVAETKPKAQKAPNSLATTALRPPNAHPAPPRDPRPASGWTRPGVFGSEPGKQGNTGMECKAKTGLPWVRPAQPDPLPLSRTGRTTGGATGGATSGTTGGATGGALATPLGIATANNRLLLSSLLGRSFSDKENVPPHPNYGSRPPAILSEIPALKEGKAMMMPRTLRIPDGFPTIAAALLVAEEGDELIVNSGTYKESLVIDKPVTIRGIGEVLVEVEGKTAVVVTASHGLMEDVIIRQMRAPAGSENTSDGKFVGVDVHSGQFRFEHCDIESHSGACVAIHSIDANPTVRNCTIHDGKQAGVYVFDGGRGILQNNDIYNNEYAGVLLKRRGNPTLIRNKVRHGKETGIFVCHESSGTMEENEIYGNQGSGIVIKGGGSPTIVRNQIHGNRQAGIFCCDRGSGTIRENDIHSNCKAGVLVKTAGNPALIKNLIHGGKETGVYVFDNGEGCLQENHIYDNQNAGVLVTTGGNPQLLRNRIERNKYEGLWVCKGGKCHAEANDLRFNLKGAMDIQDDCVPFVTLFDNVT